MRRPNHQALGGPAVVGYPDGGLGVQHAGTKVAAGLGVRGILVRMDNH